MYVFQQIFCLLSPLQNIPAGVEKGGTILVFNGCVCNIFLNFRRKPPMSNINKLHKGSVGYMIFVVQTLLRVSMQKIYVCSPGSSVNVLALKRSCI
jgi:hypothetical protein